MARRIFTFLIPILLSFCFHHTVSSDSAFTFEIKGSEAVIQGMPSVSADVCIPEYLSVGGERYTVTEIAERAFYGNTDIERVTLPDTVKKIGNRAFAGCVNLKNVNIPEGVEVLEQYTFSDCRGLKSVILPRSLVKMSYGAFKNCVRLERIIIKAEAFEIFDESETEKFFDLTTDYFSDNEIPEIKNSLKNAMGSAVYGGTEFYTANAEVAEVFTSREIPRSKVYVGTDYGVREVTDGNLKFEIRITPYGSFAALLGFADGEEPNINVTVDIPESITVDGVTYIVNEIADYAFFDDGILRYSNHIVGVNFPDTIEKIGEAAFYNTAIRKLVLPKSVRVVCRAAFKGCTKLGEIELNEGIRGIGSQCFYGAEISTAVLPESLEYIDLSAFRECSALTQLVVSSDNTEFSDAFSGAESVKVYVTGEKTKSALVEKGFNSQTTEVCDSIMVLKAGYNRDTAEIRSVASPSEVLPLMMRALHKHIGWTDGMTTYAPGDTVAVTGKVTALTAVWEYDFSENTKLNADIVSENASDIDSLNRLMKKDETTFSNTHTDLNVKVSESVITKEVNPLLFGVTTCGRINVDMLIENSTGELSQYALDIADELPDFTNVRGDTEPLCGLFDDISAYESGEMRIRLKAAVNALAGMYLKINPECEFIFILPVYCESQSTYMSPEACVNMHKFFTFEASESEWAALREDLGFKKIKIRAYELGNETYYNCRGLDESAESLDKIESESRAYAAEAVKYYNEISPYAEGVEFSASLVSEDCGFWQDEWNVRIMRALNEYTRGLYSLHTYYGKNNSPSVMTDENVKHITDLYHSEIGYFPSVRFAHTEHAVWGSESNRTSLMAGLAEMMFLNNAVMRSDAYCADYHTFAGGTRELWSIINDSDGRLMETVVSKAYKMYIGAVGNRVVKLNYSDVVIDGRSFPITDTDVIPNSNASLLVTADGSDTLILHMVNAHSEKDFESVTFNFDFENEYSLVSERVYGGFNPYSTVLNAETENTVWIKQSADNLTADFTSYTVAPNTAAVLVLKTESKIGTEVNAPSEKRAPSDGIYIDVMSGAEMNENGEYELGRPKKLDYVYIGESSKDTVIKACNVFGTYEIISGGTDSGIYSFTDSRFTKIKIENIDKSEIAVYSLLNRENINYVSSADGYLVLSVIENGIINKNADIICSDGVLTDLGGGRFKINLNGKTTVSAVGSNGEYSGIKIYITDNFGSRKILCGFNDTKIEENCGGGVAFADNEWYSAEGNDKFKFGIAESVQGDVNSAFVDDRYMFLTSASVENSSEPLGCAAVYHSGASELEGAFIAFNAVRCGGDIEYGIRFLVSEDGRSFYQLGIQKYSALTTNRQWILSKVTDGISEELVSGVYSVSPQNAACRISLLFDSKGIYWRGADADTGRINISMCGSYAPEDGIELIKSTFGFYAYRDGSESSNAAEGCVYIDNVTADMFGITAQQFDYDITDGELTVNGLNENQGLINSYLVIPSKIDGASVKKIAPHAFENSRFTRLEISEGIEEIGEYAFCNSRLEYASLPGTVKSLGENAFRECGYLQSVKLGEGITEITDAFYNCKSLNYFVIPQSVKKIDCNALALARLRCVIFCGDTAELANTAAVTRPDGILGERLEGSISFYYTKDGMKTVLERAFGAYAALNGDENGKKRLALKKLDCPALISYFQRGTRLTGGDYHYKKVFVYSREDIEGRIILAEYDTDGKMTGVYTLPLRMNSGTGLYDVTDYDISVGERKGKITAVLWQGKDSLIPLARVFKSVPW